MARLEPADEAARPEPRAAVDKADELAELEADLALARARVAASVHALGEEVSRRFEWREAIRNHPVLALGGAFVLGFLVGGAGRPRTFTIKKRRTGPWTWMS